MICSSNPPTHHVRLLLGSTTYRLGSGTLAGAGVRLDSALRRFRDKEGLEECVYDLRDD